MTQNSDFIGILLKQLGENKTGRSQERPEGDWQT